MRSDQPSRKNSKTKDLFKRLRKISRKSERVDLSPEPAFANPRLRRRSTELSCREKPVRRISRSLSIEPEDDPEHRSVALTIQRSTGINLYNQLSLSRSVDWNDRNDMIKRISLEDEPILANVSLQSFSSGKASMFKLRGAGSRFLFNGTSSESVNANDNLSRKMRSTWSSMSSVPLYSTPRKSTPQKADKQNSSSNFGEVDLFNLDNEMASSVEFIRNSPSLRKVCSPVASDSSKSHPTTTLKVDEMSEGFAFPPLPGSGSVDSRISDWLDQFANDTDSEISTEKSPSEQRSISTTCWSSTINSRFPKQSQGKPCLPSFKAKELPLPVPPVGMVFVAWVNASQGYRFKTFPLSIKLQKVREWLGEPLPIVVQEPGKRGRSCDYKVTLSQALGKLLKNPYKQGVAFFIGPVNGTLSYSMKVSDLDRLSALRTIDDDEEKETRASLLVG